MKSVVVLGKGELALHACEVVSGVEGWTLSAVVPNDVEPDWDVCLSVEAPRRWSRARLVRSGDWRELVGQGHDLVVSVLYNRIIGRELIEDSGRVVNCHPGRLPEYRGVRPANWSLVNGESCHGVTIHEVDEGIDTGPVVAQVVFPIWPQIDEVRDVWQRSMAYGMQLLSDTLPRIDALPGIPQDPARARTYRSGQDEQLGDRRGWHRHHTGPDWPRT